VSGFPWPIIFKLETNKIKLLTEYESVAQKVLFGNAMLAALMSGRKYDITSFTSILQSAEYAGFKASVGTSQRLQNHYRGNGYVNR
jgi:hypothetical protein